MSILVASMLHRRGHRTLHRTREFLAALMQLRPVPRFYFTVHWRGASAEREDVDALAQLVPDVLGQRSGDAVDLFMLPQPPDSREIGGARHAGAVQENLAYLRNRVFGYWQREVPEARHLLMVDSDILLRPRAMSRMLDYARTLSGRYTVSLQVDNAVTDTQPPQSNATAYFDGRGRAVRVPWVAAGEPVVVQRAGGCTLYPRAALAERFGYRHGFDLDEQDSLFDALRDVHDFRHHLLREPDLAEHRRVFPAPAHRR